MDNKSLLDKAREKEMGRRPDNRFPEEEEDALLRAYIDREITITQIAHAIDRPASHAYNWVRKVLIRLVEEGRVKILDRPDGTTTNK